MLSWRAFELSEPCQFPPSQEDDFLLSILELVLKRIVCVLTMHSYYAFLERSPNAETTSRS